MFRQRDALLRLLLDDDAATLRLVKQQLLNAGPGSLPELRTLLSEAAPGAALHLQDVISTIEEDQALNAFSELLAAFEDQSDLESACWSLASTFSPGDLFAEERTELDLWGAELARRLAKVDSPLDRVETLAEFLGSDIGLRGNEADYYAVENSLLPEVIRSRQGIPISLSAVYMFVASRAGMLVEGVGLPGHFLARHSGIFFDPFHGGARVGLEECRALLEQQDQLLRPEHLVPPSPRQILLRMLTNLYYITESGDPDLASRLRQWMALVRR